MRVGIMKCVFVVIACIEFLFVWLRGQLEGWVWIFVAALDAVFLTMICAIFMAIATSATKSNARGWSSLTQVFGKYLWFVLLMVCSVMLARMTHALLIGS
jgi:hypothetical protein